MATPEEEKAIRQEINGLIREYIDLLKQAGISQDERNRRESSYNETLSKAGGNLSSLNKLSKDLTIEVNNTSNAVKAMNDDFEGISEQLGAIVTDLGNTGDLGRKILSTFKSLRNTTDKIRDDRDLTRVLSEKQLKSEKENLNVQQRRLDREITRGLAAATTESNINKLRANGNDLAADALVSLKTGNTITEAQLEELTKTEGALTGLVGKEKERVLEALNFNKITGKTSEGYAVIEAQIEKAVQREKQLNKNMGLTSSIVEGLGKLPGLNRIFKAEDVEEVKNLAREALVEQTSLLEQANEARAAGNGELAATLELQARQIELTNRGSTASKVLGKSFSNLKETLTDPAAILAAVGDSLMRNSKLTNQFQTELGVSYGNALDMRQALANSADASGDLFINSEKLQKSFFALKETTGVFFDLSSQSAETFTNLTERIGLAGAAAGNLTMLMRLQGKETEKNLENLYDSTGAMLATSKTTASVKDILGDVATSSKGLQASLSANPGALAKAAIAARELGATLSDMEGTQKSLLDFESSIAAELEAELLTGKQLNLEKARTAALNNDLATVGEELGKQGVDLASFGKMNYLQQEAMAKAMGMSRDSMGEMVLRAEMQKKSLSEIRDTMGEQAYENAKALGAQDKINAATEKLKDIFGNLLQAFTPIIDALAMVLVPIGWLGQAFAKLNELTGGFSSKLFGAIIIARSLGMSFGDMFSPKAYIKFFKGLMSKITTSGGLLKGLKSKMGGITDGLKDKSKGMVGGLKDKVKGMLGGNKSNIKFDERMAGGGRFKDVTSGKMVSNKAAEAAGAVKPGAVPKGVTDSAKSSTATPAPKDDGKALKTKMKNIAEGIKAFASTDVIKGAVAMIIAAPGLVALSLAAIPLKLVEKINGKAIQAAMKGIANGIKPFGDSKVIAGAFNMLIAAPGLVALSIAALPLKLVEKVNGKALQAAMKGIAKGLQSFANPMAVLGGLALIPISIGLIGLGAGAIGLAAVALLGAAAAAGMGALTGGLVALGTAAATGIPFLGVLLLGAFGLALIPFGLALGLVAPLITAVGTAIATVIMSIADAVVTVMPALTQSLIDLSNNINVGGLLGLAAGLFTLGIALPIFAIGAMTLIPVMPMLAMFAIGLSMMSSSLSAIEPIITAVGTAISTVISSIADAITTVMPALTQSLIDLSNNVNVGGLIGLAAGLFTLGIALPIFAIGAMTLIPVMPMLALFALGVSAMSSSLSGIEPIITAVGTAISTVISSMADAVTTIIPTLTQSLIDLATKIPVANLFALATALPFLGLGLMSLGGSILFSAPGLLIGALVLPLIAPALAQLGAAMANVDGENFAKFGTGIATLSVGMLLLGAAAPLVLLGAGVLLIINPALQTFGEAISSIPTDKLLPLSLGILSLGGSLALLGIVAPLALAGTLVIGAFSLALMPLALFGDGLLDSANAIAKIAESIKLLDIGKVALLAIAIGGLTLALAGLMVLGPIGLGALALVGGISMGAAAVSNSITPPSNTSSISPDGAGSTPAGGTTLSVAGAGESSGEDMKAMIQETVTATIKALVPDMVAALKSGQGNIKVTNDNFNASSQDELPSQMRNVSNNNFA